MAATIQGINGNVTVANFIAKLDAWSADLSFGLVDTSGFDDQGYRTREPLLCGMSGAATGTCVMDSPPFDNAVLQAPMVPATLTAAIVLTATTGCTYSFNAVISRVSLTRPYDGKMTVTFNFVSDGRITEAWA